MYINKLHNSATEYKSEPDNNSQRDIQECKKGSKPETIVVVKSICRLDSIDKVRAEIFKGSPGSALCCKRLLRMLNSVVFCTPANINELAILNCN